MGGRKIRHPNPIYIDSLEQRIKNLLEYTNIDSKLDEADGELKLKLTALRQSLIDFMVDECSKEGEGRWKWNPRTLIGNDEGVYTLVHRQSKGGTDSVEDIDDLDCVDYLDSVEDMDDVEATEDSDTKEENHEQFKVGMSHHCRDRVNRQGPKYAAILMNLSDMTKAVGDEWVQAINDLHLPGLAFHPDHEDKLDVLIRMQFCEMYWACSVESVSNTVAERLTQVPNDIVQRATAVHNFGTNEIEFMRLMNDGDTFCALSWPSLPSQLQKLALNDREFLKKRLREAPPDGGFVTPNLMQRLLGSKFGPWEGAVKRSPRERTLDQIVEDLKLLLEEETTNDEAVRDVLLLIQGAKNYSHYVRPSQAELAEGGKAMLEEKMRELPTTTFIFVERSTISAIEKEDPDS